MMFLHILTEMKNGFLKPAHAYFFILSKTDIFDLTENLVICKRSWRDSFHKVLVHFCFVYSENFLNVGHYNLVAWKDMIDISNVWSCPKRILLKTLHILIEKKNVLETGLCIGFIVLSKTCNFVTSSESLVV